MKAGIELVSVLEETWGSHCNEDSFSIYAKFNTHTHTHVCSTSGSTSDKLTQYSNRVNNWIGLYNIEESDNCS